MKNGIDPIFILSCERSGSTMLRYIIDTHSKIACPGHLYLGSVLQNINRMLAGTIALTRPDSSKEPPDCFVVRKTREMVLNIMSDYIEAKGKEYWCEKTPMNLEFLPILESHFPDSKYICLYRHCMDVVNSSINLSKYRILPEHIPYFHRNPENLIAAMVENWLDKTERLLNFEESHSNQCFRVTYESIVMHPERTLKLLFDFLRVEWEEDLIGRVFKSQHDAGEGDGKAALSSSIKRNSIGLGVEIPLSGVPIEFVPRIDKLLHMLNFGSLEEYYNQDKGNVYSSQEDNSIDEKVKHIFENRFKEAIIKNINEFPMLGGKWNIVVKGDSESTFVIDLSGQGEVLECGECDGNTILKLPAKLIFDMVAGKRDAMEAYNLGEIQVSGIEDKEILMNFGKLLFS